ncbi:NAD-dependent epimerase/dehydratase family protein [Phaeovulum sp. W22_SRMD_FR3]|uniref:NAD-dependent epimerase/dehydratase family protein n=1 Tax=Phaeovulum sp. W22_SRMD_FR3 TaxID=3240274 RepID=UPI003F95340F
MTDRSGKARLLILGGNGRLARLLRPAFALLPEPPRCLWQARQAAPGIDLILDPLAEPQALAAAMAQAEVTLVLAGRIQGNAADLAVNSTLALAALAAAAGHPVLLASSAAVYGAGQGLLREDGPAVPLAPYGIAKQEMEAAAALQASGPCCSLRIGNVAGADALLGQSAPAGGRILDIFADGRSPARSYIGPMALAVALDRLAARAAAGESLPDRLNLALPGAVEMADLLRAAGERFVPRPAPVSAIASVELDVSRAVALGLVPASSPAEGPDVLLPGAEAANAQARAILADLRMVQAAAASNGPEATS